MAEKIGDVKMEEKNGDDEGGNEAKADSDDDLTMVQAMINGNGNSNSIPEVAMEIEVENGGERAEMPKSPKDFDGEISKSAIQSNEIDSVDEPSTQTKNGSRRRGLRANPAKCRRIGSDELVKIPPPRASNRSSTIQPKKRKDAEERRPGKRNRVTKEPEDETKSMVDTESQGPNVVDQPNGNGPETVKMAENGSGNGGKIDDGTEEHIELEPKKEGSDDGVLESVALSATKKKARQGHGKLVVMAYPVEIDSSNIPAQNAAATSKKPLPHKGLKKRGRVTNVKKRSTQKNQHEETAPMETSEILQNEETKKMEDAGNVQEAVKNEEGAGILQEEAAETGQDESGIVESVDTKIGPTSVDQSGLLASGNGSEAVGIVEKADPGSVENNELAEGKKEPLRSGLRSGRKTTTEKTEMDTTGQNASGSWTISSKGGRVTIIRKSKPKNQAPVEISEILPHEQTKNVEAAGNFMDTTGQNASGTLTKLINSGRVRVIKKPKPKNQHEELLAPVEMIEILPNEETKKMEAEAVGNDEGAMDFQGEITETGQEKSGIVEMVDTRMNGPTVVDQSQQENVLLSTGNESETVEMDGGRSGNGDDGELVEEKKEVSMDVVSKTAPLFSPRKTRRGSKTVSEIGANETVGYSAQNVASNERPSRRGTQTKARSSTSRKNQPKKSLVLVEENEIDKKMDDTGNIQVEPIRNQEAADIHQGETTKTGSDNTGTLEMATEEISGPHDGSSAQSQSSAQSKNPNSEEAPLYKLPISTDHPDSHKFAYVSGQHVQERPSSTGTESAHPCQLPLYEVKNIREFMCALCDRHMHDTTPSYVIIRLPTCYDCAANRCLHVNVAEKHENENE